MKKDEFLEVIKSIGTCEDEAQRRTMLADLSQHMEDTFNEFETAATQNNQYKEDNEKLREANMKLFLQIGAKDKPEEAPVIEEEKPKLKFEDLFNEKGGLK